MNAVASRVGFDWVLNAGGVITRTAYGDPDLAPGTQRLNQPDLTKKDEALLDYLNAAAAGGHDSQPDIFHYNFNGYTGKFFIGDDGLPLVSSYEKIKIEPFSTSEESGFTITTVDGVKYFFGGAVPQNTAKQCAPQE
ncbi:hypothetical protein [Pontibacter sp. H249]|uniref:hypothetical protein n=1 Tax=Pontibacter sp. H249 TaxID=3133420 RepID=UPI0030BEDE6D